MLLKLLCCKVGTHQCDDVANDRSKVTPDKALAHNKVYYGTNKGKMPIVPKVDVHSTGSLCDKHKEVHTKTDRYDKRTNSCIVCNCCCCRPAHVKYIKL